MLRLHTILLLCWLTSSGVSAQPRQLSFDHLGVEDGLPDNFIYTLLQDRQGYIWVGTFNGLARYNGYQMKTYPLDALKTSVISTLYEDRHGTLWVGTRNQGLYRFDRATDRFIQVAYHSAKSSSLSADFVASIHLDRQDNIWIVSSVGSAYWQDSYFVDRLDPKTGRIKHFPQVVPSGILENNSLLPAILEDSRGQIWLGTQNGLKHYNSATDSFTGYLVEADSSRRIDISSIYEAPSESGILWLGVFNDKKGHYLLRFDTQQHTVKTYHNDPKNPHSMSPWFPQTIVEDKLGRFWVQSHRGISRLDRQTGQFTHYILEQPSTKGSLTMHHQLLEGENGNFWMFSYQGLIEFDPQSGRYTRYQHDDDNPYSLPRKFVTNLLKDHTGSLWVGTRYGSLHKLNQQRSPFTFYSKTSGYQGGAVLSIAEDKTGIRWLNTHLGLTRWDSTSNRFQQIQLTSRFSQDDVDFVDENAVVDGQGMVWCSRRWGGLDRYDPNTGAIRHFGHNPADSSSLSSDNVDYVYVDRAGTLWVSLIDHGSSIRVFCCWRPATNSFVRYILPTNLKLPSSQSSYGVDWVNVIYEDRQGILWLGMGSGGFISFDRAKGTFTFHYDPHHIIPKVNGFHEDRQGRFWVYGSRGGLQLYDRRSGQSTWYSEKEGLLQNSISSILEDDAGQLWLGHERGITRFNPQTHAVRQFTLANGLPAIHFTSRSLRTKGGQFIYGSQEGILVFRPEEVSVNSIPPQIVIESVQASNPETNDTQAKATDIRLSGQQEIRLAYNQNKLVFHYVGLHYTNAELNTYAYRLEGYDQNWVQAATQRTATYTNLSPGTYTFWVKAANADGVWNEKSTSIRIIIYPPWWRTWWAYIVYVLVVAGSIWAFIEYRSRAFRKENQVLEQKVAVRTAEVIQQKEEIAFQRDQVTQTLEHLKSTQTQLVQKEKMASLGELTAGIAHEIQNPLNFVNNFSELSSELLEELEEEHQKPQRDADLEVELLTDLKDNLHKILHHGNRAASIVKGMLEHARSSNGEVVPTDLNKLAAEFLRLAYHGMRGNDSSFNCELVTDFDSELGLVTVMPQEIGRVLLNLFSNAFYAVRQQQQTVGDSSYKPTVSVTTSRVNGQSDRRAAVIRVRDNGTGMSDMVKAKIFQPFFTTKPTGQGTGLGLSLSYDIVTKGHSGSLIVESQEGQGAEFVLSIPIGSAFS